MQLAVDYETYLDVPKLMGCFESLGDNCDLGMVQRAIGIEPFGLFRFAGCTAEELNDMLINRLEPFGSGDDFYLSVKGYLGEYFVQSRSCSYQAHTERFSGRHQPDVVEIAERRKLGFLKQQLLRDLSAAAKLFVFRGRHARGVAEQLHASLQSYGRNWLLWVDLADRDHPPGTVARVADGLLKGYVSRFGVYNFARPPDTPVSEWVAVCAGAYRLWRDAEPPGATIRNLIPREDDPSSLRWSKPPWVSERVLPHQPPEDRTVIEHGFGGQPAPWVCRARAPVDGGGPVVFSVSIRLPENFRERNVILTVRGARIVSRRLVNPDTPHVWQRAWIAAILPDGVDHADCVIAVEGSRPGDTLQSCAWCLERGSRPSGLGVLL